MLPRRIARQYKSKQFFHPCSQDDLDGLQKEHLSDGYIKTKAGDAYIEGPRQASNPVQKSNSRRLGKHTGDLQRTDGRS
jgi:hypothetical protein